MTLNTPVTLPAGSAPLLYFHSYEQTENVCGVWDFRLVQISDDGGSSWDSLGNLCTENTWYKMSIDLSDYAGRQILLRFLFDTIDSECDIFFADAGQHLIGFPVPSETPLFVTQPELPYVTPNADND
jgi:hypothetical protein